MAQPIVDTHVHFWNPERIRIPWLSHVPRLNRTLLPEDFRQASDGFQIEKIVFVECDCLPDDRLAEAAWVASLAQQEPRIQAIVASAPLELGEAARPDLERLSRQPLVRGIRRLIQSEADGFCIQPDFVRGVKLLKEFDFSFDICIRHWQLADTIQLVEQCPEVSFVLDHIGKPDIKGQRYDPWRADIQRLAGFPNVWCKVSGLVTEADHERWTPDDLRPYLDHVFEVFGTERLIYGGDWPVSTMAATYRGWMDTLNGTTAELTETERDKLFYSNALAFYRLNGA